MGTVKRGGRGAIVVKIEGFGRGELVRENGNGHGERERFCLLIWITNLDLGMILHHKRS